MIDSNYFKSLTYNQKADFYRYLEDCDDCGWCLSCTGILQYFYEVTLQEVN